MTVPIRTHSPYPMLTVVEATHEVLSRLKPLAPVEVDFRAAAGLALVEDVTSSGDLPPARRSGVDGYAVVARPGPLRLRVLQEVTAGHSAEVRVDRDTAVRIMTGGVLPRGADAVVMFEDTREQDGYVEILAAPRIGDHVQAPGLDAKRDQVVLRAGRRLGSAEIGMLAAVGRTRVKVHPRPRVALLATGDEVVEPEIDPPVGYVRHGNRYALVTAVAEAGGEVVWSGHCPDDRAELERAVAEAVGMADVLITSCAGNTIVLKSVEDTPLGVLLVAEVASEILPPGVLNVLTGLGEEIFGPVLVAIRWTDEQEVIRMANDSHYGLAVYVWTHDVGKALRAAHAIEAGWVQVNQGLGRSPGHSYGGYKESGIGREFLLEGMLDSFIQRKNVTVNVQTPPAS